MVEKEVVAENSFEFNTNSLQGFCWADSILLRGAQSNELINKNLLLMQSNTDCEKHELRIKNAVYQYSSSTLKETLKYLYDYRCTVCGVRIYHLGWTECMSRKEQWHYLSADVHHILPLSKGGPDSYENMICLCPNCHRKFHTGEYELKERGRKLICKDQVLGHDTSLQTNHQIHLL